MPALGELEALVMRKVWDRGQPVTVREIVGDLQPERPVAYTTVMTVMDNLRRKGWLRRQQAGRAYRYEALVSAQEYGAGLIRQALAASSDRAGVLLHFIGELSADEATAVEAAYRRLTGENAS
ncbi:MAG: BlaI/MecI/CopY family transcriptional regulator [Actinobacteria bacterium]|nr:BlaI/MecI/CopY family transcriptional regulator [Actinomycetota bacterium]MBO0787997.1 BlaI/MecI/CopY family transcriptional regulator [Actinomycetota bacterium]MBO0815407.1 BlaI/MecI/CopY family transcriptional regulator [Actinomycetota bacterium]